MAVRDGTDKLPSAEAVIEQIDRRLAGEIGDAALAAWAFDRFYSAELAEDEDSPQAREATAVAEALDALMFADAPQFSLDAEALRALRARLALL